MRQEAEGGIAFAPRLPDAVIHREQLVERLESSRAPLLIVRAPSASGKSTLIGGWLRRHPRPGVWVALDPSAGRRLVFWQRIVDAVVQAGFVPEDSALRGIVTSPESAAGLRGILVRGFTQSAPITVVLDDFHEVVDAAVHDDLHWLLQSGARLRLVVSTRTASQLEQPDHVSRVDTTVILPSELILSPAEVRDVAHAVGADPSSAPEIHDAFAGWALPTRAALLELASGRAETTRAAIENVRAGSDHLPLHLEPASDDALFLLRCSIAPRLTPSLADRLGGEQAPSHLARLERDGFGSWTSAAGRSEFTIHPYLRQQLEEQLDARLPDEVPGLRAAYAADRIENDDPMEAAHQFALIGDLAGIVHVIRRFYGDIIRLHIDELVELLRAVEPSKLRRHPELIAMLLLDAARNPGERRAGILHLASFGIAGAQARFGHGDPVDRISLLMTLLASQRLSGNYEGARHTAERAAQAIGTLDVAGRDALRGLLPHAVTHVGTSRFYTDDLAGARSAYEEGALVAREFERPWAQTHAESMLSLVDATRGDLAEARVRIARAEARIAPQGWRGTYTAAGHHLAAAYLALEDFDAEGARAQLDELAPHESTIEHWPLIAHLRAMAALVDGTPYAGLDRLERDVADHADRPPTSRAMISLLTAARVDLLLADRQPIRAADVLRSSRRSPATELSRARWELIAGDYAPALDRAAGMAWSDEHSARTKASAMLTVALAARHLHQVSAAREATLRAVDLLAASTLRLPLIQFPRSELQTSLTEAGVDPDELLAGVPDVFPPLLSGWRLTPAELRVLDALATTASIDALAGELHLSSNTVKTHLRRLYRKLGARSRDEALGIAALHGMVEGRPDRD